MQHRSAMSRKVTDRELQEEELTPRRIQSQVNKTSDVLLNSIGFYRNIL